ncbi:MAG: chalcone isomerase family protein [candidate division KSB1 bacterium]
MRFLLSAICCFSLAVNAEAQDTFTEPGSMKIFPKQVTFEYAGKTYTLKATGAAEQKRSRGERVRQVMTLAHYMANPPAADDLDATETVRKDKGVKQFTFIIASETDDGRFAQRLERSLQSSITPATSAKLKKSIAEFVACFKGNFKANDQYTVRWLPDGKTEVAVAGQPPKIIANVEFAPFYWGLWFNLDSPVSTYDLLSLLTSF